MAYCPECGSEVTGGAQFCPECGADVGLDSEVTEDSTAGEATTTASKGRVNTESEFLNKYGAKPLLPLAEVRYKNSYSFAKLVSKVPIIRNILSFFAKIAFSFISIFAKIFSIITLGSSFSKRFSAEVEYAKDCYRAGMNGDDQPPSPP
jgi:uncharacterized membrane protein YvbJ